MRVSKVGLVKLGLAAVAAAMLFAAPVLAKEIVIKFSHVTSGKAHPKYLAAEEFAKRVNTRLKGKVRVEVRKTKVRNPGSVLRAADGRVLEIRLKNQVVTIVR